MHVFHVFLEGRVYRLAFCVRITGLFASPPQNYFQFTVLFSMSYFLQTTTGTLLHRLLSIQKYVSVQPGLQSGISEQIYVLFMLQPLLNRYHLTVFCKQTESGYFSVICGSIAGLKIKIRWLIIMQKAYQNAFQLFHCTFRQLFLHCCRCRCRCHWTRLLRVRNKVSLTAKHVLVIE